ncbi:hypothetical protein [Streptacidiphilus sp. P02-A3a]|nr:hypothetical protein [Streptacidiphilus sp. P02-A3a]QMU66819.1 hypothetical protein GXP74_20650 [Streptacidiphilus sp. P02-A3a]QMU66820.1 hypothetical protein GXP74_20720 [Streptacidiphilus sp. P02-A3a]
MTNETGPLRRPCLDPTDTGRKRWAIRWKAALNAFDIAFDGRLSAARR